MASAALDDLNATFECGPFVRDASLSDVVLARYIPGLLVRELTFCDASFRLGGFVAPHRYLIFSSDARSLTPAHAGLGTRKRDISAQLVPTTG